MLFKWLRQRYRAWMATMPHERLRRVHALLPDGAFSLEGMFYTREDLRDFERAGEPEILVEVIGEIADEYEDQRGPLPEAFWPELEGLAREYGYPDAVKRYWVDGRRIRAVEGGVPRHTFHDLLLSRYFDMLKEAGQPPVAIALSALRSGGGEVGTVKLLRGLFGLDLTGAMAILREAQSQLRSENV